MIYLLILLLLLLVILWIKYINCCKSKDYTFKKGETMIVKYLPDTPKIIKDNFKEEFNDGAFKICECNHLVMITLNKDFKAYGMGGGAMKPTPVNGQGIDSVYKNDKVKDFYKSEDNSKGTDFEFVNCDVQNRGNLKIAVLDTGIDPAMFKRNNLVYSGFIENPGNGNSCFKPDPFDNNDKKHGTKVTQFLMKQFEGSGIDVKIIPFKVLDENMEGDIFDIVCAIYAAQKQGVNAIVASLGYLGESIGILQEALDFAKENKITFFTAAGNIKEDIIDKILSFFNPKHFYPATYSLINSKVFSISSIRSPIKMDNKIRWCPNQNSRKKMINAYVEINSKDIDKKDEFCYFNSHVTGTSYATPIFAGQYLKRSYNQPPLSNNKSHIKSLFNENEIEDLGEYGLAIKKNSYKSL